MFQRFMIPAGWTRRSMSTDEDAFEMARVLTLREGIFCGISSGAAMWGALEKAKDLDRGLIVTLFPG